MQTYNLFRRQNERWEWAQSLDVSQLSDFDAEAAEISTNTNGFYLFHSTDSQAVQGGQAMPVRE